MLFYSMYALIGFVCGVYFDLTWIAAVISAAALIFTFINKKTKNMFFCLLVFVVFMGLGNGIMKINSRASCYTEQFVTVSGRISEIPYKSNDVWCYTLNCEEITFADKKEKFKERICVYSENEYKLSDSIDVSGFLKLFDGAKNPGCFDSYTYYKSIGINYKMTAFSDCLSENKYSSHSPYSLAVQMRNKICTKVDENFEPDNAVILKYILTGYKKEIDRDYTNRLLKSGVLRNLYSPYFHLILVLGLSNFFLKGISVKKRRFIICGLCVLYLCVNPYSLSGRKLFTYTIFIEILRSRGYVIRNLDVLWAVILLCGIQNPYVLYNEGFLMSCCATIFIILFYTKIYTRISWVNKHKAVIRVAVMFFISGILLTPIGAYLFDGMSLYSIFISILMLPIISTIYIISPLMLIGCDAVILIIDNLVTFIRNLPIIIEKLPFSYFILPRPSIVLLASYLLAIGAIYKRKTKAVKVLAMSSLGLLLSFSAGEMYRAGKPEFSFLSAGQGDCSVLDIPYKCTIMVDTGGTAEYVTNYDVGAREIFPYLRHSNIKTLDYVFISHYHKDHCDGITTLMDLVKIKNIFLPDYLPNDKNRVIIEGKAREKGIKVHYIKGPGKINLDGGVLCEVLYFDKDSEDENDKSVVMRLEYDGVSCLYTGDITKTTEEKLIDMGVDLKADILKVAHHGSKNSSSDEFLAAADPEIAVAMTVKENVYDFPTKDVVLNMQEAGIEFVATPDVGSITIKIKDGRLIWQRKTR